MIKQKKLPILIVEDDELHAKITRKMVDMVGFEVTDIVSSCEQALASIKRKPPSFVLMDVYLHGKMLGIEIAEQINRLHPVPIIYTTSCSQAAFNRQSSLHNHSIVHSFIEKPVLAENLTCELFNVFSRFLFKQQHTYNKVKDAFWLKVNDKHYIKIKIKDILYVESLKRAKCKIVTNSEEYEYNSTLITFSKYVPHPSLERVSQKDIVNYEHVVEVQDYQLKLDNGIFIKIGQNHWRRIMDRGYLLKTK